MHNCSLDTHSRKLSFLFRLQKVCASKEIIVAHFLGTSKMFIVGSYSASISSLTWNSQGDSDYAESLVAIHIFGLRATLDPKGISLHKRPHGLWNVFVCSFLYWMNLFAIIIIWLIFANRHFRGSEKKFIFANLAIICEIQEIFFPSKFPTLR